MPRNERIMEGPATTRVSGEGRCAVFSKTIGFSGSVPDDSVARIRGIDPLLEVTLRPSGSGSIDIELRMEVKAAGKDDQDHDWQKRTFEAWDRALEAIRNELDQL